MQCSLGEGTRPTSPPADLHLQLQPLTTRPVASRGMLVRGWPGLRYSTLSGHSRSFVSLSRATPRPDKASICRPADADADADARTTTTNSQQQLLQPAA